MIGFTDFQLLMVQQSAEPLPIEKRATYLERVIGYLEHRRGGLFDDNDVQKAVAAALKGLLHESAA